MNNGQWITQDQSFNDAGGVYFAYTIITKWWWSDDNHIDFEINIFGKDEQEALSPFMRRIMDDFLQPRIEVLKEYAKKQPGGKTKRDALELHKYASELTMG